MKITTNGVRVSLAAVLAVAVAGCGGHARTVLEEIRGASASGIAAALADEGYSVGALRTAELPGGTGVVLITPEPSDGYAPQVTAFRLEGGLPIIETEAVCDPFQWASQTYSDAFYGLDPAPIASVAWEAWQDGDRRDLVVDITMNHESQGYGGSAAKAEMRARCSFRKIDEPPYGELLVPVFGWIERSTMVSDYGDQRTETLEEHSMRPVDSEPDQFDFQILTKTVTCSPDESGRQLCIPETNVNIRRFALAGEGIDSTYIPLGDLGYLYPYGPMTYQPLGVYGTPGGTYGDPYTDVYGGTGDGPGIYDMPLALDSGDSSDRTYG